MKPAWLIRAHAENKDNVVQCRSAHQIARKTSHAATLNVVYLPVSVDIG